MRRGTTVKGVVANVSMESASSTDGDRQVMLPGMEGMAPPSEDFDSDDSPQESQQEKVSTKRKRKKTNGQDSIIGEHKKQEVDKKRSWGEVMILESLKIPHPAGGDDSIEVYRLVEASNIPGQSTVEAEQWLLNQMKGDDGVLCPGKYMIIRKVKVVEIKEEVIRQVTINEVDE